MTTLDSGFGRTCNFGSDRTTGAGATGMGAGGASGSGGADSSVTWSGGGSAGRRWKDQTKSAHANAPWAATTPTKVNRENGGADGALMRSRKTYGLNRVTPNEPFAASPDSDEKQSESTH